MTPSNVDDVAEEVARALGGTIRGLNRLSGGASRVTSALTIDMPSGVVRDLILQVDRSGGAGFGLGAVCEAAILGAAQAEGVPVPGVVAVDRNRGRWLVVERIEGETIPRKILRDPEWARARAALTRQCGTSLAAIHRIDATHIDGVPPRDRLQRPLDLLDALGQVRPVLELGARWLAIHPAETHTTRFVHGDFRLGNLLIGPNGLEAVLDWELAHLGDPAEDLGWLSSRTWRFGGAGEVGGFGELDDLLDAYRESGGEPIKPETVRWWQAAAAIKWAAICALQASAHLHSATRSVELAAIGRRICESEWDLLLLLGLTSSLTERDSEPLSGPTVERPPFGRPTALELIEAVREFLDRLVDEGGTSRAFETRVARNALRIAEREVRDGESMTRAHAERLAQLGWNDDESLAAALRRGDLDDHLDDVGRALAASTRDQLIVANPTHLDSDSAEP